MARVVEEMQDSLQQAREEAAAAMRQQEQVTWGRDAALQ
jgi:hypothetical protein